MGTLSLASEGTVHAALTGLIGDSPIREGVVEGFLLIFLSELGDKTFFIAALLALKYKESRGLVFGASFGALAVMTVISVRHQTERVAVFIRKACGFE